MSQALATLRFQRQSVVVGGVATSPLTINSRLLVQHNVVPADWKSKNEGSSPVGGVIEFDNGIRLFHKPSALTVSRPAPEESEEEPQTYEIADAYLATFPSPSYKSLELSWVLSVELPDAQDWLLKTFVGDVSWSRSPYKLFQVNPWFLFQTPGAECHLRMNPDRLGDDQGEKDALGMICSFYHDGPFDLPVLRDHIREWTKRKAELAEILAAMGLGR